MTSNRSATLVVDLAFGDSGKGTIVDFIARRARVAPLVVRFNGGPQAGHNVVAPDGRHHTFSQFGSATFVAGARTLLARFMVVEPYALLREAEHLQTVGFNNPLSTLAIAEDCPIITPVHQAANRIRELARGQRAHGTCGMGVGETMQDLLEHPELSIRARDLADRPKIREQMRRMRDLKMAQLGHAIGDLRGHPKAESSLQTLGSLAWVEAAIDHCAYVSRHAEIMDEAGVASVLRQSDSLIFEGAQGVLLDESFGFHPHTTWSTTTFANAQMLLKEAGYEGRQTRLGVLRSYLTRHGAGPFVTEDASLRSVLKEPHNDESGWQGAFRVGRFDAVAARYAIKVSGGIDGLALTHLDRLHQIPPKLCDSYFTNDNLSSSRISHLAPPPPDNLVAREAFTQMLFASTANYVEASTTTPEAFMKHVSDELGSCVQIASYGPTADDKSIHGHL